MTPAKQKALSNKLSEAKKTYKSLGKMISDQDDNQDPFTVHVPAGTTRITIQKATIRDLLQRFVNLPISDFHVSESEDGDFVDIDF